MSTVLGIDPGQTTGIYLLDADERAGEYLQASPGVVLIVVRGLLEREDIAVLAIERFVVGPRAARSSTPKAGQIARELIVSVASMGEAEFGTKVVLRAAAEVKPWATDARLDAAGLLASTKGAPHARDAARHALFAAVKDCGIPDPLSRRGT